MKAHDVLLAVLIGVAFGCGWQAGQGRATHARCENGDQVQGLAIQAFDAGISTALRLPRWSYETELAAQLCRSRALLTPGAPELADAASCAARSLKWAHRFDVPLNTVKTTHGDVLARQEGKR